MTAQQFHDKYFGTPSGTPATAAPYQTDVKINFGGVDWGTNQVVYPVAERYCATRQAAIDLMGVIAEANRDALAILHDPNSNEGLKADADQVLSIVFTESMTEDFPLGNFRSGQYSQSGTVPFFKVSGRNAVGQNVSMTANVGLLLEFFSHGETGERGLGHIYNEIQLDLHDINPDE